MAASTMTNPLVYTPYGWPQPEPLYLEPTRFLDFDQSTVEHFASDAMQGASTQTQRAVQLFYAV